MFLHVTKVKYISDYIIWLRFSDETEGIVDLEGELWGEIFAPLKDKQLFKRVSIDPEIKTVVWENEADFAPEFLYEMLQPVTAQNQ